VDIEREFTAQFSATKSPAPSLSMSHNSDSSLEISSLSVLVDAKNEGRTGSLPLGPMTGSQRKTAFALRQNVEQMINGSAPKQLVEVEYPCGTGMKKMKV